MLLSIFSAIFLSLPFQDLAQALRDLESPSSLRRAAAEKTLVVSMDPERDEFLLLDALREGGGETRLRLSRLLGERPESFSVLVRWMRIDGEAAWVAREALRGIYLDFRGAGAGEVSKRGGFEEAPQDAFRRVWGRLPREGTRFLTLVERLHRAQVLDRPLLLAPDRSWDDWVVPGIEEGEFVEGFASQLFMRILQSRSAADPSSRVEIRAYPSFLWVSRVHEEIAEEDIFLRLCSALGSSSERERRIAALDLGRLGFGPAEKLFAERIRAEGPFWKEFAWGLFSGQGVSPWLRDRATLTAAISKLGSLEPLSDAMAWTLRKLGRADAAGEDLDAFYEEAIGKTREEIVRTVLWRCRSRWNPQAALSWLRERAQAGDPESLNALLAFVPEAEREKLALDALGSRPSSPDLVRLAAFHAKSDRAFETLGRTLSSQAGAAMRAADGLHLQAISEALWRASQSNDLHGKFRDPRGFEDVLLFAGIEFADSRSWREKRVIDLRDPQVKCPEFLARAVGRSADALARDALAEMALDGGSSERGRLAALKGLEAAIDAVPPLESAREWGRMQSKLAPLRLATDKLQARFEAWIQRSLKPPFEGENFWEDAQ